jgi:hypothetical protein
MKDDSTPLLASISQPLYSAAAIFPDEIRRTYCIEKNATVNDLTKLIMEDSSVTSPRSLTLTLLY